MSTKCKSISLESCNLQMTMTLGIKLNCKCFPKYFQRHFMMVANYYCTINWFPIISRGFAVPKAHWADQDWRVNWNWFRQIKCSSNFESAFSHTANLNCAAERGDAKNIFNMIWWKFFLCQSNPVSTSIAFVRRTGWNGDSFNLDETMSPIKVLYQRTTSSSSDERGQHGPVMNFNECFSVVVDSQTSRARSNTVSGSLPFRHSLDQFNSRHRRRRTIIFRHPLGLGSLS